VVKWTLVALAACSSGRAKAVEDARTAAHAEPPPKPATDAPAAAGGNGDVQIRVEWHDVPAVVRASPGRTACGTALAAAVAPTTTWGIPDAFVVVSGQRGKPAPDPSAQLRLDRCALAPVALVAGGALAVTTTASEPGKLAIRRAFALTDLGTATSDAARPILLPIAGHEVDVALEPGNVYEVVGATGEVAFVAAAPNGYVAVTDAAGQAVLRDLPVGSYKITAWLPPHAGQPARLAHGDATVTAGALAEVTLDLSK
jgi:hypothetical protein